MTSLRPRFSMRWLLIAVAVLTVLLDVLFVRPTVVANQFAGAIEEHDFERAASLLEGGDKTSFATNYSARQNTNIACEPSVSPRAWSDIWHFRRIISVDSHVSAKYRNKRTGKDDFKSIYHQKSAFESGPF